MTDLATTDPPPGVAPPVATPPTGAPPVVTPSELLRSILIDSRQRWRELVNLAADFAFETDEWGRFTLVTPDPALNWAGRDLIGQPAGSLLAETGGGVFNPFRVSAKVRHRQAWLKRGDGGVACLAFSASPINDATGRVIGVRGVGIDVTELDGQAATAATSLRHSGMLTHLIHRMSQEVIASRMMDAALDALMGVLGAEGVAVVLAPTTVAAARLAHVTGTGAETVIEIACQHLLIDEPHPREAVTGCGRPVLMAACETRFGERAALVVWRLPRGRAWDTEDSQLLDSAVLLVRMILDREAIQLDMTRQARTDPLTGLLNRRAFLEEIERHAARLDREHQPGTLMFADLDDFKIVNDRMGHEAGDDVLRRAAGLLRKTFRPTDLIARLGGDEFAIWMDGADHMTAAERAEYLREAVPTDLVDVTGPDLPRVTMSIGIASRAADDAETLDSLMRRADRAMYEVKRGGRGHWRVSLRKRA